MVTVCILLYDSYSDLCLRFKICICFLLLLSFIHSVDEFLDILIDLVVVFSDEALPESSAEIVWTKIGEISQQLDTELHTAFFHKIL